MSHPIQTWFARHVSHPLTDMYARLDEHQQNDLSTDRPSRPTPVDVSWMPMPPSHARNDHSRGR
ncbi:hypothetical protein E3T55_15320 [Cryobacterium frigoriphilum]|uniref:Uncharacterized protein n=1 Tax=Cryobacterium frigoriphilum TaxID=1259150 RepID=A0A4R8ZVQ3_9MICO|nr:hypothetical protein [Cryobacterium frigoriphilum]TFD47313.1 hypothetical protein E3T55_15320 [Cryobacterium frigoriphilum]